MAIFEITSRLTRRYMRRKSKQDLRYMVRDLMTLDNLDRLTKDELIDLFFLVHSKVGRPDVEPSQLQS